MELVTLVNNDRGLGCSFIPRDICNLLVQRVRNTLSFERKKSRDQRPGRERERERERERAQRSLSYFLRSSPSHGKCRKVVKISLEKALYRISNSVRPNEMPLSPNWQRKGVASNGNLPLYTLSPPFRVRESDRRRRRPTDSLIRPLPSYGLAVL